MPVDPSISLGIATPQMPGVNLGMVGQFAQIQNAMNQATMFRQQWQANTEIGEIMAAHPGDLNEALNAASQSPRAPWAAQAIASLRQAYQTQIQTQGEIAKQAATPLEAVTHATLGQLVSPGEESYDRVVGPVMKGLPEGPAKQIALQAAAAKREALFGNLPTDKFPTPEARAAEIQKRAGQLLIGSNALSPEIWGTAGITDFGGVKQPTLTLPGWRGGGTIGTAPGVPLGTPAGTVTLPGQVTIPRPAISGEGVPLGPAGGGGYPLGTAAGTAAPPTNQLVPGGAGTAAPRPQPQPSGPATGFGGLPILSEPELKTRIGFAEDAPKHLVEINERVMGGQQLKQQMATMYDLMQQVQTGPAQQWEKPLSTFGASIGLNPKIVDKLAGGGPGALDARMDLEKYFLQYVTGQMRSQIAKGSRWNINEWEGMKQSNPNLFMTPGAIDNILQFANRMVNIDMAEQAEYPQWLGTPEGRANPENWGAEWNNRLVQRGWMPEKPSEGKTPVLGEQPKTPPRKTLNQIFAPPGS